MHDMYKIIVAAMLIEKERLIFLETDFLRQLVDIELEWQSGGKLK